ncbi:hypothetical protein DEO72_LG10g1313 [Vigna unguiculata]|uniref:Secreted protein n=1 Tax=Vigna unguiculata TaxID=3917 RepID=A0A4D6NDZ0_VIGUN|nr:hypothetical protein DEO72_LG10g1313 [Vigna unguiculata]
MMLTRTCPLVVLPLRTSPLVVLLYGPARPLVPPCTWHLSTVSTEHTNLPHSYPHVRVNGYEPPRSYHHMLTTIHEPTRSWHNISRSKCSSIAQTTHQANKGQQHFRLARPTRRQAKLFQTAWQYPLTARRQRPSRVIVSSSSPGGAHRAAKRHSVQGSLMQRLSPGGYQWTARRHTRSILQLVWHTH